MNHSRNKWSSLGHIEERLEKTICLAKSKRPKQAVIRRAIGKQLRYVKRDLKTIDLLLMKNANRLTARQQIQLDIIRKLYQQQKEMYNSYCG